MNRHRIFLLFSFFYASTSFSQQVSAPSIQTEFQNFLNTENTRVYKGSALPVFFMKEDTKGSPYLFDKWVKGSVTNYEGEVFRGSNILFNYDKMGGNLMVLVDSNTVIQINSADVGSFTLTDSNKSYTFERLKNSTDRNFYQPLIKNEKGYSLYKLLITKFKKADYESRGIVESGNKYDEFKDDAQYYILTPKRELIKLTLKQKAIRNELHSDLPKVDLFFSTHKKQKLSEEVLRELVTFLNS